jgi:hypothetical protein
MNRQERDGQQTFSIFIHTVNVVRLSSHLRRREERMRSECKGDANVNAPDEILGSYAGSSNTCVSKEAGEEKYSNQHDYVLVADGDKRQSAHLLLG